LSAAPIRTALVGYGLSGASFHAPLLAALDDDFALTAVVSSRPEAVRADRPAVAVFPTLAALLAAEAADLCVVTTVNTDHAAAARACLAAGRHVVVEKPFVLATPDGVALDALASRAGRVLGVYHNRRFDAAFRGLMRAVAAGEIGRPHTMIARYDRWRPEVTTRWRESDGPGSGILWDLGAHLIDQALVLFGGLPAAVTARVGVTRPGAVAVDHFHLVLDYGDRAAFLSGDNRVAAPGPALTVHGDRGSFVRASMDEREPLLRGGRGPRDPAWNAEAEADRATVTTMTAEGAVAMRAPAVAGGYELYYRAMAEAIRSGGPAPVTARDGTRVVAVIEAAMRSAAEGRTVAPVDPFA
jgi:scyllo-inositol 2-dehydrogenase (NADP+)